MKMTMCKERLCSHTSAAACHAGTASACADTTAQARSLSVKNTMRSMVLLINRKRAWAVVSAQAEAAPA